MNSESVVYVISEDASLCRSIECFLAKAQVACRTFDTGRAFEESAPSDMFGCLVLDLGADPEAGVKIFGRLISQNDRPMPMIVLGDLGDMKSAVACMKRGAFDYAEKPIALPSLSEKILDAFAEDAKRRAERRDYECAMDKLLLLGEREWEVLHFLLNGLPAELQAA